MQISVNQSISQSVNQSISKCKQGVRQGAGVSVSESKHNNIRDETPTSVLASLRAGTLFFVPDEILHIS